MFPGIVIITLPEGPDLPHSRRRFRPHRRPDAYSIGKWTASSPTPAKDGNRQPGHRYTREAQHQRSRPGRRHHHRTGPSASSEFPWLANAHLTIQTVNPNDSIGEAEAPIQVPANPFCGSCTCSLKSRTMTR